MAGQPPAFITVKYGENQQAVFNPWCPTHILLTWIRKKCSCDEEHVIDLVNTDGDIQNLPTRPYDYAHHLLDSRQAYILVKVTRLENIGMPQYVSLLNDLSQLYPEVNEKLTTMNRPLKPVRKDSKWNSLRNKQISGSRRQHNTGSTKSARSGKSATST